MKGATTFDQVDQGRRTSTPKVKPHVTPSLPRIYGWCSSYSAAGDERQMRSQPASGPHCAALGLNVAGHACDLVWFYQGRLVQPLGAIYHLDTAHCKGCSLIFVIFLVGDVFKRLDRRVLQQEQAATGCASACSAHVQDDTSADTLSVRARTT